MSGPFEPSEDQKRAMDMAHARMDALACTLVEADPKLREIAKVLRVVREVDGDAAALQFLENLGVGQVQRSFLMIATEPVKIRTEPLPWLSSVGLVLAIIVWVALLAMLLT